MVNKMLNGLDISAYQPTDVLNDIPFDFVVIKATEGDYWVSPNCDAQYQSAVARGKLVGVYHFSNANVNPGQEGACREAAFFVANIQGYLNGQTLLVLDHEMISASAGGASWAKWFMDEIVRITGFKPMLYGSRGIICNNSYSIVNDYPLWVAAYGQNDSTGYDPNRDPGNVSPWPVVTMFQYTSRGRLSGYNGDLDLNVFYGDSSTWMTLAAKVGGSIAKKSVDQLAQEVIGGAWGNGDGRRQALSDAGYDYSAVQARVNDILGVKVVPRKTVDELANEVIRGSWGDGSDRANRLTDAGYDYTAVQNRVNDILQVYRKSNSTVANEVIRGEWGNGQVRRDRLTRAGYDYDSIMSIVNQRI